MLGVFRERTARKILYVTYMMYLDELEFYVRKCNKFKWICWYKECEETRLTKHGKNVEIARILKHLHNKQNKYYLPRFQSF
jgi:hypothetical protein